MLPLCLDNTCKVNTIQDTCRSWKIGMYLAHQLLPLGDGCENWFSKTSPGHKSVQCKEFHGPQPSSKTRLCCCSRVCAGTHLHMRDTHLQWTCRVFYLIFITQTDDSMLLLHIHTFSLT